MTKRNRGKRKDTSFNEKKETNEAERPKAQSKRAKRNDTEPDVEYDEHLAKILDDYTSRVLGESAKKSESKKEANKFVQNEKVESVPQKNEKEPAKKEVEVVVFKSVKRKAKEKTTEPTAPTAQTGQSDDATVESKYSNKRLNSSEMLEKLKFDVGLFGMKALSKEEQRELERKRAIKLGAVPPKREFVNYKALMEQKLKKKSSQEAGESSGKKSKSAAKKRTNPAFWAEGNKSFTPQIGKYKDGILKISAKEIKSMKRR